MSGWLGIAAFVTAYDIWAASTGRPTLSAEFASTSKTRPLQVSAATVYLVVHLYEYWPRYIDPLCLGLSGCGSLARRVSARRDSNAQPAA